MVVICQKDKPTLNEKMMKKIILIIALIGINFGVKAQEDWPVAPGVYSYFGAPTLDQSQLGNYALLQNKDNGKTFLNSPSTLSLRINNSDKMVITDSGILFDWPASPGVYSYFGTPTLDQSQLGNYALLQNKDNGKTFLNSPSTLSLRINNSDKMVITDNGILFDWPASPGVYSYFGTPTLDQSQLGNYALLQKKDNGKTFLNSPSTLSLRINNSDKMVITDNGILFDWPASPGVYSYFGTPTLDQSQLGNYALLQNKDNGKTFLNSPSTLSLRINNSEKMVIDNNGNIGISKNNPTYKLDVNGAINASEILINGSPISNTNTSSLWLSDGSDINYTSGNVGIGTIDPKSKLVVNGEIRATKVRVLADISVPDYVFESDYELRTLQETKKYIVENKHLPEIPSAAEIGKGGIDLGDMNMRLLKKIEELTLYQIELLEKMEQQNLRIEKLEKN